MTYDKDIREPLFFFLDATFGKNRIIEEKRTGKSRADAVMVTDHLLYGIEIKSDADTYARLAKQVKDYDKFYDRNIVVVGSSHSTHIEEHVPAYWGIIIVREEGQGLRFEYRREALPNPRMKWKKKLEILWRPELAQLQETNSMPKYKEKSKAYVCEKILERLDNGKLDLDKFSEQMCDVLFERDYTVIAHELESYRVKHGTGKRRLLRAEGKGRTSTKIST